MLLLPRLSSDVAIVHVIIDVIVDLNLIRIEIQRLALVRLLVRTSVRTFIIIVCSADARSVVEGTIII